MKRIKSLTITLIAYHLIHLFTLLAQCTKQYELEALLVIENQLPCAIAASRLAMRLSLEGWLLINPPPVPNLALSV